MTDHRTDNQRIAKNTLLLYLRMFVVMLVSLYTSRVILATLGNEDYGIYNVIGGIVAIFSFLNTALTGSTQRFLNFNLGQGNTEKLCQVFNASQVIHVLFALIIFILAEAIIPFIIGDKLTIPTGRMNAAIIAFHCSIITICFLIISFPYNAVIIAREKMSIFAIISIFECLAKLAIAISLSYSSNDKLVFYAVLLMIQQIVVALIYRIYCMKKFDEVTFQIRGIGRSVYREILGFTSWNIFGNIASVCLTQGTNVLLNLFFSPVVNAAKGISMQVQNAVNQLVTNFQTAQNPQIVKSYAAGEINYMHQQIYRASRVSFSLSLLVAIPIIIKTDWILNLWLVEPPEYASVFIQFTMFFSLIQSLANPLLTGVMATGNLRKIMTTIAIFFWMIIPICYVVLRLGYSPVSVFVIQLVMYIIAHIMRIFIASEQLNMPKITYLRNVIFPLTKVAILSFATALFLNYFLGNSLVESIICIILIVVSNSVVIWFLGIENTERQGILNFFNNFYHRH